MNISENIIKTSNLTLTVYNQTVWYKIELWKTAFYITFAIIIAIGNMLTIIAVSNFKYLQTSTYVFVLSLSVADFLLFPPLGGLRFVRYIQDDLTVKMVNAALLSMMCLSLSMSLMTLVAIAVDRYKAVMTPFTYKSIMTVRRARRIVAIMWTYGIVTMVPTVTYYTFKHEAAFLRSTQEIAKIMDMRVFIVLVPAQSALWVLISVVLYVRVYLQLRHRVRKAASLRGVDDCKKIAPSSEVRRTTKMMGTVLGAIVITWLPFNIISVAVSCSTDKTLAGHVLYTLGLMVLYANSFLNPIIYVYQSPLFRRAYKDILTCGKARPPPDEHSSLHEKSSTHS